MKDLVKLLLVGSMIPLLSGCGSISDAIDDAIGSILKFNDTDYAIPDNDDVTGVTSAIDITTSGIASLSKVRVTVKITHPQSGDLKIVLESPLGTEVILSENNGDAGDDVNVLFYDDADKHITDGDVPLEHRYIPQELLENFNGESPVGVWKLHVYDTQASNTGTLTYWGLYFE